ncbi:class I SAM-dependent methyltransferase [Saccharothrix syringae]|uniref:class I SAM-dependent methyltransferase n=1 Tax=Saccharothrix syringae TaxID=103733 RepID=UPI00069198D9|nr:class I SAM-dependent methyltransferase [Saccharothrix syringae]
MSTPPAYGTSCVAHHVPGERSRLGTLEAAFDPVTTRVLDGLDLPETAVCLELGAGAGSVAAWLAAHRPHGRVVATDTDTRFLRFAPTAPVRVLRHDVVTEDFPPASFDLVHARALLSHLPDRDRVLRRAARWVRPGGRLVVEDLTVEPVDDSAHPLLRQVTRAGEELLRATVGTDLRWARALPERLRDAGLHDVRSLSTPGTVGDGSPADAFWTATFEQAVPAHLATGSLRAEDVEAVRALHRTPGFTATAVAMVTAWGTRPRPLKTATAAPRRPFRPTDKEKPL